MDLNPPFSLLATLLIAPIAWTSLQWATYSAQQNGEIKSAASFKDQAFIIVGSLVLTGLVLALLAFVFQQPSDTELLYVAGAGYWAASPRRPWRGRTCGRTSSPRRIANNPIVTIIIAVGFILNGHQIVHNCYIGMTRVMVAMSLRPAAAEMVSRVRDRLHTPVNAHLIYFVASLPVIYLYNNYAYDDGGHDHLELAHARRFVRVWLRVRGHRDRRRAAALPGEGALRGVAGRRSTHSMGIPLVSIVGTIGARRRSSFLYLFLTEPSSA